MPPNPSNEDDESARASRTLVAHATSTTTDLYALLSLPAEFTPSQLKKAWRKAALDYHPDKNIGKETESAELLDAARKAFDVLSDPAARVAYDDRMRAKREKAEREGKFEEKRKRMKEDLERRESGSWMGSWGGSPAGGKRKAGAEETEAERREREVRRLAADGARRRGEREEQMRREREEEIEAKLAGKKRQRRKTGDDLDSEDIISPIASTSTPIRANRATTSNPTTPSFSFRKPGAGTGTPNGSNTPSLFEATMARLRAKEAEKRRLEADIRDDDAAAAAIAADVKV